jgi:uncharacterized protein YcnI
MPTLSRRTAAAAGLTLGCGVLLLGAGPASAHVSPDKSEVPAGGFTAVTFTVGHGCEESPTTRVDIQVPESILDVTPGILPGWDITVATEPLDEPVESAHGEEVTERESVVTFTAQAGNELPDGFRLGYTLGFQAPETVGEVLYFKTIQVCAEGQTEWIEEWDGTGEEPEHPSPAVTVTEAEGDGHGGGAEEEEATDDGAAETTTTLDVEEAAATSDDDDGSSDGLAIAALVVGVVGLIVGGVALATARKTAGS